jgi:hypothetical protein
MSELETSLAEILNTRFVEIFQIALKKTSASSGLHSTEHSPGC